MLLWEWLIPLQQITDTGNISIFVLFIALSLLLTFFRIKWYYTAIVQVLYIFFVIGTLFYQDLSPLVWLPQWAGEAGYNIGVIQNSSWMDITSSFRTFLFFILLWLLVYLLHYWMVYQKRMTFFFIMTLIYITVVDTFTAYDAKWAIVRVLTAGFLLLGLLSFERLKVNEKVKGKAAAKWMLPLIAITVIAAGIGFLAPKSPPQWPDPIPFLKAAANLDDSVSLAAVKKIGYGTNDQSLGGPFMNDSTPVFQSFVENRHYWRVETKDVYTGKGWEISKKDQPKETMPIGDFQQKWFENSVKTEEAEESVVISPTYSYSHLIYPLGLTSVETDEANQLDFSPVNEMLTPAAGGKSVKLSRYTLKYDYPTYNISKLSKGKAAEGLPKNFVDRYTQLPRSTPARVKELAATITEGINNDYDKAKAIEQFLGSADFSYNTKEVAIPARNQDYVDQFLFDTKQGYCDNFSTSMVVLLREAGIPARWVKGYNEGDYQGTNDAGKMEYTVTNNSAHSWVEVFFAGTGWVQFEPTKGFSNPSSFQYEEENEAAVSAGAAAQTPSQVIPKPEKPEEPQSDSSAAAGGKGGFSFGRFEIYAGLGIILAAAAVIYFSRRKWMPRFLILKYRGRKDDDVFFQAYGALLKQLALSGFKRDSHQTLREFAKEVDRSHNSLNMLHLTSSYERALYRRDHAGEEWRKSAELWENLIKNTSS
nr:transglutaminaseTgpA domain-containing protein [Metabacillus kandeliae]